MKISFQFSPITEVEYCTRTTQPLLKYCRFNRDYYCFFIIFSSRICWWMISMLCPVVIWRNMEVNVRKTSSQPDHQRTLATDRTIKEEKNKICICIHLKNLYHYRHVERMMRIILHWPISLSWMRRDQLRVYTYIYMWLVNLMFLTIQSECGRPPGRYILLI